MTKRKVRRRLGQQPQAVPRRRPYRRSTNYRDYHNQHLTVDRDHKQPRLPINYVPELLLLGAVVLIALIFFLVDGW